jgi:phosphoserine phosphatase
MMKFLKSLILVAAAISMTACNAPMPRGNWSKVPYKALCQLMKECKAEADAAGHNVNYAVFDYDNTTVLQDVELACTAWQIENLRFKFSPDLTENLLSYSIPDTGKPLEGIGTEGVSSAMIIADIASDYRAMVEFAGVSCGWDISPEQLAEVQQMPEFFDFRAKLWALYEGLFYTFSYHEGFPVLMGMLHGMTYPEVDAMMKEGIAAQVAKNCLKDIVWESPDMGLAGKVSYVIPDGLALSQEMRNLYKALPENGIDVYVYSASMEAVVEAMACDPKYLGLDTAQVFALRLIKGEDGLVSQDYLPGYVQPYKTGKTEAIRTYTMPKYDGRDPVLIGGDSNGDYSMLTSFPGMRVGLIIDKGQTNPGIGDLRKQALDAEAGGAPSKYVLQRRGDPKPEFKRK